MAVSSRRVSAARTLRSSAASEFNAESDKLLAGMQTPASKKGMKAAFDASPEALGRAAVKAARRR